MSHEFLWCSMRGANWVPCRVLATNPVGEISIRFFDDIIEGEVEASVEPAYVREALDRNVIQPTTS